MVHEHSVFNTPIQEIILNGITGKGPILDIGGGGEGLVSRIEGSRVCAVDLRFGEIREAQIYGPDSQWIVGDGRRLCFRDSSFGTATAWFMLGYVRTWEDKSKIAAEVFRVLRPNGLFSLLASRVVCEEDRFVTHIKYELPDGEVFQTGYGVLGRQNQTTDQVSALLEETGFELEAIEDHEFWFRLEARKPIG
ncbi:MAG: class I SAM-dependent methyltransferase [Candidatus Thorarchaeota archaeon]